MRIEKPTGLSEDGEALTVNIGTGVAVLMLKFEVLRDTALTPSAKNYADEGVVLARALLERHHPATLRIVEDLKNAKRLKALPGKTTP